MSSSTIHTFFKVTSKLIPRYSGNTFLVVRQVPEYPGEKNPKKIKRTSYYQRILPVGVDHMISAATAGIQKQFMHDNTPF